MSADATTREIKAVDSGECCLRVGTYCDLPYDHVQVILVVSFSLLSRKSKKFIVRCLENDSGTRNFDACFQKCNINNMITIANFRRIDLIRKYTRTLSEKSNIR